MTPEQNNFITKLANLSVDLTKVAKRTRTLGARDDALTITEASAHLSLFAKLLRTQVAVSDAQAGTAKLSLVE